MISIIIFSSVPASAKPRSSHKPQPSHSSLTGSTRAPGAVQNACFKHTFRQMSPFGEISNTCRWTRGRGDLAHACSPLVAEYYRRGSLHMKWRRFMPDYYNLFHLVKWNAPQRGLQRWSGLKMGCLRPQRQMRNRPRVVCEDVSWILHAIVFRCFFLLGRKKRDVNV